MTVGLNKFCESAAAACVLVLLMQASHAASVTDPRTVADCRRISDQSARLACYDKIPDNASPAPAISAPVAPAPAVAAPTVASPRKPRRRSHHNQHQLRSSRQRRALPLQQARRLSRPQARRLLARRLRPRRPQRARHRVTACQKAQSRKRSRQSRLRLQAQACRRSASCASQQLTVWSGSRRLARLLSLRRSAAKSPSATAPWAVTGAKSIAGPLFAAGACNNTVLSWPPVVAAIHG